MARSTTLGWLLLAPLALACDKGDDDGANDSAVADDGADDGSGDDGSGTDDGTMAMLCAEEDRDEEFGLGVVHEGASLTVTVADADPAVPIRGDNAWTLMITDADDAAMEDMVLEIRPWMPDHGHGSPIEPTSLALGEGQYLVNRLNLHMAGYWEITIGLDDGAGLEDEVVFKICVE